MKWSPGKSYTTFGIVLGNLNRKLKYSIILTLSCRIGPSLKGAENVCLIWNVSRSNILNLNWSFTNSKRSPGSCRKDVIWADCSILTLSPTTRLAKDEISPLSMLYWTMCWNCNFSVDIFTSRGPYHTFSSAMVRNFDAEINIISTTFWDIHFPISFQLSFSRDNKPTEHSSSWKKYTISTE